MGKGIIGRDVLELGRIYIGIEKETTMFLSAMNTLHEQLQNRLALILL
jgi:hypothetical protein